MADVSSILSRQVDVSAAAPESLRDRTIGVLQALGVLLREVPVPVVNPPSADVSNASKMFHQLHVGLGRRWRVPESLLTNDPDAVRTFQADVDGDCVIKGASAQKTWVSHLTEDHLSRMTTGPSQPILVQRQIHGPDVRVHVVGSRVFAEQIDGAAVDYRPVRGNAYQPIVPPVEIADECTSLARRMRVPLIGVDFKVERGTGAWYWLEANSAPCYEGYDRRAGRAISNTIVDYLSGVGSRVRELSRRATP